MLSTSFLFRFIKTGCVLAIGILALLITFDNLTDYYSNYWFVAHVMKMDTTFPGNRLLYRSITHPWLYHAAYIFIIGLEGFMSFCSLKGSWLLWKNIKAAPETFYAAKNWAVAGLGIGILIWFLGFEVLGGEWFAMWQSTSWNGLGAAERILTFLVLVLILLHLKDE
jgi:predicted small integral membrane protein